MLSNSPTPIASFHNSSAKLAKLDNTTLTIQPDILIFRDFHVNKQSYNSKTRLPRGGKVYPEDAQAL